MDTPLSVEEAAKLLIRTIFRMCRDRRTYQLDIADVGRSMGLEYAATKELVTWLERQGYVETLTFGQKVGLTDAGIVVAQRLIH